jgi:uncharacterized protein
MRGCSLKGSRRDRTRHTPRVIVRRRGLLIAAVCAAAVLALGRAWGTVVGEHAWYAALGFAEIWWWKTTVALLLKIGAGTVAALAMRAHFEAVRGSIVSVVVPGQVGDLEISGALSDRAISIVLWCVALFVGALLTVPLDDWRPLGLLLDARPFGESDPYFLRDLAFWTDWLPLERQLFSWAILAHVVMSLLTVCGYILTRGIGVESRLVRVSRHARRHITVLGAMLMALVAWAYRLDGFERLIVGTSDGGAFGFADHRVGLPGALIMQVVALSAACVVAWSAWSRQPRSAIASVTTVLLMALLLKQGVPLLADRLVGGADPVARDAPYLEAGASFTRRAYEADRVVAALVDDTASVAVTPLWDAGALPMLEDGVPGRPIAWGTSESGLQAVSFTSLRTPGVAPRWRRVLIAPAESAPFADSSKNVAALPPIIVSDSGGGYAIISDPGRQLAAPSLSTVSARFAHAWNQQNPRLALGALPQPAPVLITTRDVRSRLATLLPTLTPSEHVSAMIVSDSLLWAVDLYATSATYPLSEPLRFGDEVVNAAQFAMTALVNAHTGRVSLVGDSDAPALASRLRGRYARYLLPERLLAPPLRSALPPRADALMIEGAIAARLGSRIARSGPGAVGVQPGAMRELALVRGVPPDSSVLADPFSPIWLPARGTYAFTAAAIDASGRVRGVMIAPGGVDRRTRWRPAADAISYDGAIRAAQDASDSLRRQGGRSAPRRGASRVLPTSGAPLFVTPFYRMKSGRPDEVAAVLISDGNRRSVGSTGTEASVGIARASGSAPPMSAAAATYIEMRAALRRGAWTEFGTLLDALGRSLGVGRDSTKP